MLGSAADTALIILFALTSYFVVLQFTLDFLSFFSVSTAIPCCACIHGIRCLVFIVGLASLALCFASKTSQISALCYDDFSDPCPLSASSSILGTVHGFQGLMCYI